MCKAPRGRSGSLTLIQDKEMAANIPYSKSGARNRSPWDGLRLRSEDVGFLDWNTAAQDFRSAVTSAMEDAHMVQGAIDLVVSKLPM